MITPNTIIKSIIRKVFKDGLREKASNNTNLHLIKYQRLRFKFLFLSKKLLKSKLKKLSVKSMTLFNQKSSSDQVTIWLIYSQEPSVKSRNLHAYVLAVKINR